VRISGRGNIKSIGDITVPDFRGFRVFAPKARESMNVERRRVGGEKTFDLVLVPESPGDRVIPAFEFSYFDPAKESYVTLSSDPIDIKVLPGDVASLNAGAPTSPGIEPARTDIRYIKREEISRGTLAISHGGAAGFLMMYVPAIAGIVGLIVSVQRRRALVSGKGAMRRAHREAKVDFRKARALADGETGVPEGAGLAARAVRTYLSALTGTSETLIDRSRVISVSGIGETTKSEIADLLDTLDRIRFAPIGADAAEVRDLIDKAETLLKTAHEERSK
jgi:hypothetical protein